MMKNSNTTSWQTKAHEALDQIELYPEKLEKLSWSVICRAAGVSRSTLWRNKKVKSRFLEIQEIHRNIVRPTQKRKRPGALDVADKLRRENAALRKENDGHLLNYVEIARRLDERGVDPVQIFAGLSAASVVDAS